MGKFSVGAGIRGSTSGDSDDNGFYTSTQMGYGGGEGNFGLYGGGQANISWQGQMTGGSVYGGVTYTPVGNKNFNPSFYTYGAGVKGQYEDGSWTWQATVSANFDADRYQKVMAKEEWAKAMTEAGAKPRILKNKEFYKAEIIRQGNEQYREWTRDVETTNYKEGSEFGTKSIGHYVYSSETGQLELQYTDVYVINEKGEYVKDYKQSEYFTRIMNNNKKIVVGVLEKMMFSEKQSTATIIETRKNRIASVGCLLTAIADVATFYGIELTPADLDEIADVNKYYGDDSSDLAHVEDLIKTKLLGKYNRFSGTQSEISSKLIERINEGKPTIARFIDEYSDPQNVHTHFVVVSGMRLNAQGQTMHLILTDPGSVYNGLNANDYFVNTSDLIYQKKPSYVIDRLTIYDK